MLEIAFKIHEEDKNNITPGMVLAVDTQNPDYYVLADKDNTCIIGVVSNKPICISKDKNENEYSVSVAFTGRIKVNFDGLAYTPRIGCWAILHPSKTGYTCCTLDNNSKELNDGKIVGRIIKIIDDSTVEILLNLG